MTYRCTKLHAAISLSSLKAFAICVEKQLDTPCLRDMDWPSQCLLHDKSISLTKGRGRVEIPNSSFEVKNHQTLMTSRAESADHKKCSHEATDTLIAHKQTPVKTTPASLSMADTWVITEQD